MKDIFHTIKKGKGKFYEKFHRYPTHLRIGRGFIPDVLDWQQENKTEFSYHIKYVIGLNVEFDMRDRDVFELYGKKILKTKVETACHTIVYDHVVAYEDVNIKL